MKSNKAPRTICLHGHLATLLAALVIWSVAPALAIEPDQYEPDNTALQARVIFLNAQKDQHHNFHTAGDQDWVKIFGLAGVTYQFGTNNVGSRFDASMEIYDTDRKTLLTRECRWQLPGEKCVFEWRFLTDRLYYLKVTQKEPEVAGEDTGYDLYATDGAAMTLPGTITGKVTDSSSPAVPLQVSIKCSGKNGETSSLSEADGDYYIYADAGDYTCTFDASGYTSTSDTITVEGGVTTTKNYTMVPRDSIDLKVTKASGPEAGQRNTSIQITTTVKNQGQDASGSFKVGIFLSQDTSIKSDKDKQLSTFKIKKLEAGASIKTTTTVTLPDDIKPGTYYIGAIADVKSSVVETNEGNNAKCSKYTISIE